STGFRDLAPKFFEKAGTQLFLKAKPGKCLHAERQKRLADVETGKLVAFEHDHASPCFAEQGRRGAAGGAAADNRNIITFHRQKVAEFAGKQRVAHASRVLAKASRFADFSAKIVSARRRNQHAGGARYPEHCGKRGG